MVIVTSALLSTFGFDRTRFTQYTSTREWFFEVERSKIKGGIVVYHKSYGESQNNNLFIFLFTRTHVSLRVVHLYDLFRNNLESPSYHWNLTVEGPL